MTGTTFIAFSSGTNDLILGLAAAALVVFALVVSLVVPRRWPEFPRRSMGLFIAVAVLLVAGMLVAVEALGESHHFNTGGEAAGTGETKPADTTPASTGSTATETGQSTTTQTQTGAAAGDPAAGKALFASAGCAGCHTLKEAGASGTVGPNLDDVLKGKSTDFIRQSIVDPNAEIVQGYSPGIMPQDYGSKLSDKDLADLVAFLNQSANG